MAHTEDLDLDYRPDHYLSDVLSGIKGTLRRAMVLDYWTQGRFDEIESELLKTQAFDSTDLGKIHPMWMGGEYLEDDLPGELMLARIELQSTTGDVIELRVRPLGDGGLGLRWVDEYETEFNQPYDQIERPLSLGELIKFIEASAPDDPGDSNDHHLPLYFNQNAAACGEDVTSLKDFTSLSSPHYPELEIWFKRLVADWWARVTKAD